MVDISAESLVATAMFFSSSPEVFFDDLRPAKEWKQAFVDTEKHYTHCCRSLASATTISQLESKKWIVNELQNLNLEPKVVGLLGGWYSNFLTPLLLEKMKVNFIWNFEIDRDAKDISYKFNKRYKDQEKYQCHITDIMFKEIWRKEEKYGAFDVLINTSCEHMFPMRRFRELNKNLSGNPIYVLQSTNEDKYEDHINCVSGPEELAEQAEFVDIMYSGTKTLDNGMERFMVIGK